jgi:hypothetical protein
VNQTRSKVPVRGTKAKSKSGRRSQIKVKSGPELPLLPIAVGSVLIALAIALIVIAVINSRSNNNLQPSAAGIPCDQLEHTQVHYHAAIQIMYGGVVHPIPGNIGIVTTAPSCFYWLHVHASDPNIIHIESPKSRQFTLGDFFAVWSTWSGTKQLLDSTHVSTLTVGTGQTLVIYVDKGDGKGAQVYTGDPNKIVLLSHEVITLEITPPTVTPPPAFTFPAGL